MDRTDCIDKLNTLSKEDLIFIINWLMNELDISENMVMGYIDNIPLMHGEP